MMKRIVDVVVAAVGLVVASPFMLVVGALIRVDSPGPAFFRQDRVGRRGKTFRIIKFRTMHSDANASRLPLTRHEDVRITSFGRWLRRTKLDELPQLWNVLAGDMSLVGPRPEVPRYVAMYPPNLRDEVLSVRPGLTDLASLEYYDESSLFAGAADPEAVYVNEILPRKLALYRDYAANHSLRGDARIIALTISALCGRRSTALARSDRDGRLDLAVQDVAVGERGLLGPIQFVGVRDQQQQRKTE